MVLARVACALGAGSRANSSVFPSWQVVVLQSVPGRLVASPSEVVWPLGVEGVLTYCVRDLRADSCPAAQVGRSGHDLELWEPEAPVP
eukprot:15461976-Alexandrium_andersonii.AAC.1